MSDHWVASKEIKKRIRALEKEKAALEFRIHDIEEAIEELAVTESPIKVGDLIEWESHKGRTYRGRVKAIQTRWHGFAIKCDIVTLAGRAIGTATVETSQYPTKIVSKKKKS